MRQMARRGQHITEGSKDSAQSTSLTYIAHYGQSASGPGVSGLLRFFSFLLAVSPISFRCGRILYGQDRCTHTGARARARSRLQTRRHPKEAGSIPWRRLPICGQNWSRSRVPDCAWPAFARPTGSFGLGVFLHRPRLLFSLLGVVALLRSRTSRGTGRQARARNCLGSQSMLINDALGGAVPLLSALLSRTVSWRWRKFATFTVFSRFARGQSVCMGTRGKRSMGKCAQ